MFVLVKCEWLRSWFEELKMQRVAELKRELVKSENSIGLAQMYKCIYVSIKYNYLLFPQYCLQKLSAYYYQSMHVPGDVKGTIMFEPQDYVLLKFELF